jgi:hypothetical protein
MPEGVVPYGPALVYEMGPGSRKFEGAIVMGESIYLEVQMSYGFGYLAGESSDEPLTGDDAVPPGRLV